MTYVDTSALIKRFLFERGSHRVRSPTEPAHDVATVAYAELYAALNRKQRDGDLSQVAYAQAAERIEMHWPTYVRVALHGDVLALMRTLTERHPLRGFDAIHLASAFHLARILGEAMPFAAADTASFRRPRPKAFLRSTSRPLLPRSPERHTRRGLP